MKINKIYLRKYLVNIDLKSYKSIFCNNEFKINIGKIKFNKTNKLIQIIDTNFNYINIEWDDIKEIYLSLSSVLTIYCKNKRQFQFNLFHYGVLK